MHNLFLLATTVGVFLRLTSLLDSEKALLARRAHEYREWSARRSL